MANEEFEECIRDLRQGIAASAEADSLARVMERAIVEAETAIGQGRENPQTGERKLAILLRSSTAGSAAAAAEPSHVLLNAYKQR